jgi:hypothetical protein
VATLWSLTRKIKQVFKAQWSGNASVLPHFTVGNMDRRRFFFDLLKSFSASADCV